MPLGVRDVLLVIRAKDQASRQIREVGLAMGALGTDGANMGQTLSRVGETMIGIGAGLTAIGIGGIALIHTSINAFMDFDAASRKTLTQVSGFPATLKEIEQVALDVGRAIPVPFEQIQPALFDIFSSIPVKNMQDAKDILLEMSKAAVAGSTDIQTVARSNFEVMNAFGLKTSDLNKLLDVQFQLVRLGIGDYASINAGIGRLAPTAQIAGQSIETMAGSLAFATRIMGPGGTAISAVSRAFEALANPKVVSRLKDMGIAAVDATGNFRPFGDVLGELSNKLKDLPNADKIKVITDLFKGAGGTIQARRFLTEAVTQFGSLDDAIKSMSGSAGALDQAYAIMAAAPSAQVQTLANAWDELKISLGDAFWQVLAPTLTDLMAKVSGVVDWFMNLDDGTKKLIAQFIIFGSIGSLIAGAFLMIVGAALLFVGVLVSMGMTVGGALALLTGIPIILALIVAAIIWMVANWDTVGPKVMEVKDAIINGLGQAADWFSTRWKEVSDTFSNTWDHIQEPVERTLRNITGFFHNMTDDISAWWDQNGGAMLAKMGHAFAEAWQSILQTVQPVVEALVNIINWGVTLIDAIWEATHKSIFFIVETTWNLIAGIIEHGVGIITNVIQFVANLINGDWGKAWHNLGNILGDAVGLIVDILIGFLSYIVGFGKLLIDLITAPFLWIYDFLVGNSLIPDLVNAIIGWFQTLGDFFMAVFGPILTAFGMLWSDILQPAIQVVSDILTWLWQNILSPIADFLGNVFSVYLQACAMYFAALQVAVQAIGDVLNWWWNNILSPIASFLSSVFMLAIDGVKIEFDVFRAAIGFVSDVLGVIWHSFLEPVAGFLGSVFMSAVDGVRGAWDALRGAIDTINGTFSWIWHNVLEPLAGFLGDAFRLAVDAARGAWDALRGAIDAIGGTFSWLNDNVFQPIIGALQHISDLAGTVGDTLGKIGGGIGGLASHIPGLAVGGILTSPTLATLAERGPEVVIPLTDASRAMQLMQASGLMGLLKTQMPALPAGPSQLSISVPQSGGTTVYVNVAEGAIAVHDANDPKATAEEVMRQFEEMIAEATQQGVG